MLSLTAAYRFSLSSWAAASRETFDSGLLHGWSCSAVLLLFPVLVLREEAIYWGRDSLAVSCVCGTQNWSGSAGRTFISSVQDRCVNGFLYGRYDADPQRQRSADAGVPAGSGSGSTRAENCQQPGASGSDPAGVFGLICVRVTVVLTVSVLTRFCGCFQVPTVTGAKGNEKVSLIQMTTPSTFQTVQKPALVKLQQLCLGLTGSSHFMFFILFYNIPDPN